MYSRNRLNLNNEESLYNRTSKYLLPQFKLIFNANEMQVISGLKWITSAIYDEAYPLPFGNNLYCVFDADTELDYSILRKNKYYVADYPFVDFELNKHVLVVKLPIKHSVSNFLIGQYSMIYEQETIDELFVKKMFVDGIEYYADIYSILTRRDDYNELFKLKIKEEFNTDTLPTEIGEYDFPPMMENEVLNFNTFDKNQYLKNDVSNILSRIG